MPVKAKPQTPTVPQSFIDCRDKLGHYYLFVNPGYKKVDYQQDIICPALEGLERGEYDRLMLFMPSRHAKSDIATKAFIPWFLSRNPRKNVILLCHTQPLANDFGSHIRDRMSNSDRHKAIFPHVRVDGASHAKDFFKTNQGNVFYAFSITAGVAGRGADLMVLDDLIANVEDAHSELIQHNLFETYKSVVKQRLQAGGRILCAMTRWASRDIVARILEDEGEKWRVVVLPAQTHRDGCVAQGDCDCPYLWEGHYGRERYDEAKKDPYIWESMWQQAPQPRLHTGFLEEWLRFYLPFGMAPVYRATDKGDVLIEGPVDFRKLRRFNTYILVDPALGKTAAHDRTAILVLSAGPEGKIFLVDAVLDRLDPGERIDHICRLIRLWKPKQIGYEELAYAADTYFLNLELERQGLAGSVIVTSIGRKGQAVTGGRLSKDTRIMQLIPDFRDGRIWLPKRMVNTQQDGSKFDVISYFINREYLPWAGEGSTEHDDFIDCLSRIRDPEIFMEHVEREIEDDDGDTEHYYGSASGGSWESQY